MNKDVSGIYLVDKPKGRTSFWAVNFIKKRFGYKKVGHAGTLDPMATGLLIILVGGATKKFDDFQQGEKEYIAEITLGKETDTYDAEGEIVSEYEGKIELSKNKLINVISDFVGKIQQTPPPYSAIKIKGQPAYKRARRGEVFEIKSREVEIKEIEILSINDEKMKVRIVCSSGTYIRSLASDIGKRLGFGAYLSSLIRTRIGNYKNEDAITLENLKESDLLII